MIFFPTACGKQQSLLPCCTSSPDLLQRTQMGLLSYWRSRKPVPVLPIQLWCPEITAEQAPLMLREAPAFPLFVWPYDLLQHLWSSVPAVLCATLRKPLWRLRGSASSTHATFDSPSSQRPSSSWPCPDYGRLYLLHTNQCPSYLHVFNSRIMNE